MGNRIIGRNKPQTAGENGRAVNLIRTCLGSLVCKIVAAAIWFRNNGAGVARLARRRTWHQRSSIQTRSTELKDTAEASAQPAGERRGLGAARITGASDISRAGTGAEAGP